MKKIFNTKQQTIFLSISTLILLGALIFAYLKVWDIAYDVQEQKQFLKNEVARVESLSDIKNEILIVEEAANLFAGAYIDKNNAVGTIELMESLAEKSGVEIQIQAVNVVEGGLTQETAVTYNFLEMVLQVRGSWQGVTKFTQFVENLPHHISIDALKMTSLQFEDGSFGWSVSIALTGLTN